MGHSIRGIFEIRNVMRVYSHAMLLTLLAYGLVQIHVSVNYPPEMQDLVRGKASLATIAITLPICLSAGFLMLSNWRLSEELKRLVNRDKLTNVATRDFFFQMMADKPDLYGVSLMIDIDHFKKINDTYGHLAGDAAIAHVAALLQAQVRPSDIVCRFGGEEFVVFLAKCSAEDAKIQAEGMRKSIAAAQVNADGHEIAVTVSIGGALSQSAKFIEDAIRQADAALYRSKEGGRNRVSWAAETIFDGASEIAAE